VAVSRTTLDIDVRVLDDLKRLARAEGKSMGELASELLVAALASRARRKATQPFTWHSQPLNPRVDLEDKEAVHALIDEYP
jgi:hypothetical protein